MHGLPQQRNGEQPKLVQRPADQCRGRREDDDHQPAEEIDGAGCGISFHSGLLRASNAIQQIGHTHRAGRIDDALGGIAVHGSALDQFRPDRSPVLAQLTPAHAGQLFDGQGVGDRRLAAKAPVVHGLLHHAEMRGELGRATSRFDGTLHGIG